MGKITILKIMSIVVNLFLINIAIVDGFLYNYLTITMLRASSKSPNYYNVIKMYYIQLTLCIVFVLSLIYLLVTSFINGFLTITNFSKYLREHMDLKRKIFLAFIPLILLIFFGCFIFNLIQFEAHYTPPLALYHKPPSNYKPGVGAEPEKTSMRIILGSLKDRLAKLRNNDKNNDDDDDDDQVAALKGRSMNRNQLYNLPWDLIRFKELHFYCFRAKLYKFLIFSGFNLIIYGCLFIKFNFCGLRLESA